MSFGFNRGMATQEFVPIYNDKYAYRSHYYKLQLKYLYKQKGKISYVVNIEPSLYRVKYQLRDPSFLSPKNGGDYLEKRELFSRERAFDEYALNAGLMFVYQYVSFSSVYAIASVGPMIGTKETERLKMGFAFSDIFGVGVLLHCKSIDIDFRTIIRHNSNAGTRLPNYGHNSVGFEAGISFNLKSIK